MVAVDYSLFSMSSSRALAQYFLVPIDWHAVTEVELAVEEKSQQLSR